MLSSTLSRSHTALTLPCSGGCAARARRKGSDDGGSAEDGDEDIEAATKQALADMQEVERLSGKAVAVYGGEQQYQERLRAARERWKALRAKADLDMPLLDRAKRQGKDQIQRPIRLLRNHRQQGSVQCARQRSQFRLMRHSRLHRQLRHRKHLQRESRSVRSPAQKLRKHSA